MQTGAINHIKNLMDRGLIWYYTIKWVKEEGEREGVSLI